jgi:hypothetical protein
MVLRGLFIKYGHFDFPRRYQNQTYILMYCKKEGATLIYSKTIYNKEITIFIRN